MSELTPDWRIHRNGHDKQHEWTLEQKVAELLHYIRCHASHADRCSWGYETWEHPREVRTEYLDRARKLLAKASTPEDVLVTLRVAAEGVGPEGMSLFAWRAREQRLTTKG